METARKLIDWHEATDPRDGTPELHGFGPTLAAKIRQSGSGNWELTTYQYGWFSRYPDVESAKSQVEEEETQEEALPR